MTDKEYMRFIWASKERLEKFVRFWKRMEEMFGVSYIDKWEMIKIARQIGLFEDKEIDIESKASIL